MQRAKKPLKQSIIFVSVTFVPVRDDEVRKVGNKEATVLLMNRGVIDLLDYFITYSMHCGIPYAFPLPAVIARSPTRIS